MSNNKKFWMKRKRYGWGWTPTTWQGGLFIVLQVGVILTAALQLPEKPTHPSSTQMTKLFVIIGLVVATILLVNNKVGPSPRWRWGKKDTDKANEDF